jgi:uncharacterized protein YndB with AHSA1/START domain
MDFCEGGTSLVCMHAPQDFGGQNFYNTWTYKKIVPMQRIEFISNFANKDGTRITPATVGLPPELRQEGRNVVTFKGLGNGKTEVTVTEYDWTVDHLMEMSRQGLEQCLDKMAKLFTKLWAG